MVADVVPKVSLLETNFDTLGLAANTLGLSRSPHERRGGL
jgi:hypothetical protein